VPEHLSKGDGYVLNAGDYLAVDTPGGGGYGDPKERAPDLVERDRRAGYYSN
jgi:N-methylhydantoinase B